MKLTKHRGFVVSVTKNGATTYARTWPALEWEDARDDYFLSLYRERKDHGDHMRSVEANGTRALPYSVEGGGVLVKIERVWA